MSLYDTGVQSAKNSRTAAESGRYVPLKFSSETDCRGRDHVGATPVLDWEEHETESTYLVDKCDRLYQTFTNLEKDEPNNDAAN